MNDECRLCIEEIKEINRKAEKCLEEIFRHFHEALELRDKPREILKQCEKRRLAK